MHLAFSHDRYPIQRKALDGAYLQSVSILPEGRKAVRVSLCALTELLDEVVLDTHLFDLVELRLQPVDMVFLIFEN